MPITTSCSGCGKTLAVADEYAGRQARCPECGTIYTVPTPTPSQPSSPNNSLGNLADTTGYSSNSAPLDLSSPDFSSSTSALPPTSPSLDLDPFAQPEPKYWMRAANGAEYGPADKATLARWFSEGRVGQHYQIRQGESGPWQPAAVFQPGAAPSVTPLPNAATTSPASSGSNPYAAQATYATSATGQRKYPKSDQSGLVLAMGILAWLGVCPIFGVIGWVVGAQAISDIRAGTADPATLGLTQLGYYLSMVNVILTVGCTSMFFVFIALAAIAGN